VHVVGVQLDSPGFRPVPVTAKDTDFAPAQTIDLTTTFGAARGAGVDPTYGLSVRLWVETAGGPATLQVPVTGTGVGLIRRLHDSACAAQQLRMAASVSYGATFARSVVGGEAVLVGDVVLRRPDGGSGDPVVVESLDGSVLFEVAPLRDGRTGPVAALSPTRERVRVPVSIGSRGRCDQHARSQSTQTHLFSVFVRVGAESLHREIIAPPPWLKRASLALLDDVCGS